MRTVDQQKIEEVEAILDGKPLISLPGYVILIKKPNDYRIYGPVKHSFSLKITENQTFFFWSAPEGHPRWRPMDGKKMVEEEFADWKRKYPDWEMKIYDARDEDNLPVIIDWDTWLRAHERSDITLSGVKHKYYSRNLRFSPKDN